jgi:imidazolonepropionase-like amidohydrolase
MKLSGFLLAFILLLVCINISWAQQSAPAPKTVVIRAGRLLDVKSGKTLTNQTIIIQGDKITQVGAMADQLIPKDATVIDLPNATVLPGLIDAHTHITMTTNFG